MGEIDLSLKVTGHALVVGKFPASVAIGPVFLGEVMEIQPDTPAEKRPEGPVV